MKYNNRDWIEIFLSYYRGENILLLSQRYNIDVRTIQRNCKNIMNKFFNCDFVTNNIEQIKEIIRNNINDTN